MENPERIALFKKVSYKGFSPMRIIGSNGFGIGLAILCSGILFKLQHWPGAEINLKAGLVITLIVLLISFIRFMKNKNDFYKRIFKRIALFGEFGLILALTSDITIEKIIYRNHPDYINAFVDSKENPDNTELWEKAKYERDKVHMRKEVFKHHYQNQ